MGWLVVSANDNYQVSDDGCVKEIKTGNKLIVHIDKYGYGHVNLKRKRNKNGKLIGKSSYRLYILVAIAFVKRYRLEDKYVDHIDRNPRNNSANNLKWVTSYENSCNHGCKRNDKRGVKYNQQKDKWYAYRTINDEKEEQYFDHKNKEEACIWTYRNEYKMNKKRMEKKLAKYIADGKPINKTKYVDTSSLSPIPSSLLPIPLSNDSSSSESESESKNNITSNEDIKTLKKTISKQGGYYVDTTECGDVLSKQNKIILIKKKIHTKTDSDSDEIKSKTNKKLNEKIIKKNSKINKHPSYLNMTVVKGKNTYFVNTANC
jgi:hypothetical protein